MCTPRQFRLLFGEAHGRCRRGWRAAEAHEQETDTGVLTVVPYRRLVPVPVATRFWYEFYNTVTYLRGGTRPNNFKDRV